MERKGRRGGDDDLSFRGVKVVLDGRGSGDSGVLPAPRCWAEVRGVLQGSFFLALVILMLTWKQRGIFDCLTSL